MLKSAESTGSGWRVRDGVWPPRAGTPFASRAGAIAFAPGFAMAPGHTPRPARFTDPPPGPEERTVGEGRGDRRLPGPVEAEEPGEQAPVARHRRHPRHPVEVPF